MKVFQHISNRCMDICGSVEYNEHEIRITKLMNGYFSDTARLIVTEKCSLYKIYSFFRYISSWALGLTIGQQCKYLTSCIDLTHL